MSTAKKTQLEKIETALRKHTKDGISVSNLARMARVSKDAVYKRIFDLRESHKISSNYRNINGKKTLFYRMAAR